MTMLTTNLTWRGTNVLLQLFNHVHMLCFIRRDLDKHISLLPFLDVYQHHTQLHKGDVIRPGGDILDERFIFDPKTSKGV